MMNAFVQVIGAGLAGSEAAWQLAERGVPVRLYEMRPGKMTPAHHTPFFAELVCSNSLRSNSLENAVGVLKEEMRRLDSLIMACADLCSVPAGGALAVDRVSFAQEVTRMIKRHPRIEVVNEEVTALSDDGITVVASGPLTSDALAEDLRRLTGEGFLYFYDAVAPIVNGETIDQDKAYWASRYGKGEADYLNCPLTREEYEKFYEALVGAETHNRTGSKKKYSLKDAFRWKLARRGPETLLFGPLKPVGLAAGSGGSRPYAVVQLRKDNAAGTLLNMVGFQTRLKWSEQERVFRMIPGLEKAEFVRFGVMHRNTFINSPLLLEPTTQMKKRPSLLLAGQITGVEGYVESAASGLAAGLNAGRLYRGLTTLAPPRESALGSLLHYITHADPPVFSR